MHGATIKMAKWLFPNLRNCPAFVRRAPWSSRAWRTAGIFCGPCTVPNCAVSLGANVSPDSAGLLYSTVNRATWYLVTQNKKPRTRIYSWGCNLSTNAQTHWKLYHYEFPGLELVFFPRNYVIMQSFFAHPFMPCLLLPWTWKPFPRPSSRRAHVTLLQ